MYAQLAIEHSVEKIMLNVIINHYMMKWPLFSIKTPDGDQIRQKKPNSHSHHLPHLPLSHLSRPLPVTTTNNDAIPSSGIPYPNNLEELSAGIPDTKINIKTDDEKIIKIFGKMFPFINELDMLLSHI